MKEERTYIAIDLKSFYASVECVERGLDPLTTNLVVADASRTEKTICLAVSPALKSYGISGRARLFQVVEQVKEVNAQRKRLLPGGTFTGTSYDAVALKEDPSLAVSYIVASPQMAKYMQVSRQVHAIYLRYIAPEDMHVYSVDEVFLDVTPYLTTYGLSAKDLAMKMILEVLKETGITATAGIGTNLYLCKIAMDVLAKHIPADQNGVRIASLDEYSYREKLWDHKPITDFWRVGRGTAKKLEKLGLYTMGDVALFSTSSFGEDKLYELFGVNAELLIDHSWGYESCTMQDIKAYKPQKNSLSAGQILPEPYDFEKGKIVVREMADSLALELAEKQLVTSQLVLTVSYAAENLKDPQIRKRYQGKTTTDYYGREVPKHGHGTIHLEEKTASSRLLAQAALKLYERITVPSLLIRKFTISAENVVNADDGQMETTAHQMDFFTDEEEFEKEQEQKAKAREKDQRMQEMTLKIRQKYGKNAILKGTDLQEGATTQERNKQIGGHKA